MEALSLTHVDVGDYGYVIAPNGDYYRGCKRCGGSGHYVFDGFDDLCYHCRNVFSGRLGVHIGTLADAEKDAAKRAKAKQARLDKAEALRMVEVRKMEAKQEALRVEHPDVFEFLMGINLDPFRDFDHEPSQEEWDAASRSKEKNPFVVAMAENLQFVSKADKPFSEKMINALKVQIAERAARAAAKAEAPAVVEGRQVLSGEIVSIKTVENDFGSATKVVIQEDRGFRLYGTLQKDIAHEIYWALHEKLEADGYSIYDQGPEVWFEAAKGKKVSFTATVEVSKDDHSFGFFSRPTKGQVL